MSSIDKPFPRVLVPLDGSRLAQSAVRPAAEIARRLGVPLTLFALVDYDEGGTARAAELETLAASLDEGPLVDVVVHSVGENLHRDGFVAESLLQEAADGTLMCMSTHGHGRLGATLLGSVTERVIQLSTQPVLVVGPQLDAGWRFGDGRIVVGLDGSELAEGAVEVAAAWAETLDLPLWLVQVVEPTAGRDAPLDVVETSYVKSVAERHPGTNFDVLHSHHPAAELASVAERWPVDVLVVSSHGRSGWSRLAVGSVAMAIIHRARCPVLVVR